MILLPLAVGILIGAVIVLLVSVFVAINDADDIDIEFVNDELINWRE